MLNKMTSQVPFLIFLALLTSCANPLPESSSTDTQETLFQTSTISALSAGDYEGDLTIAELKNQGDLGLGTFNALDGEMIVIDGEVYQVKSDGAATIAEDEVLTPFAAVTYFEPDQELTINTSLTCAQLQEQLDSQLLAAGAPYALKIDGQFSTMKTRAPQIETQPYPPLADALADQVEFEFQDISGTMVGFRLPDYMQGINAVGYHLHFLTADRQAGGHVLDCQTKNVAVSVDNIDALYVDIP